MKLNTYRRTSFSIGILIMFILGINNSVLSLPSINEVEFEQLGFFNDGSGNAHSMQIFNKILFVADDGNGVLILDISNPSEIDFIANFTAFTNPGERAIDIDVFNDGSRMVVYTALGNIYCVNVAQKNSPESLQSISWQIGHSMSDMYKMPKMINNKIYSIEPSRNSPTSSLYEYRFSSNGRVTIVDHTIQGGFGEVTGFYVENQIAYIVGSDILSIYDISQSEEQLQGQYDGLHTIDLNNYFGSMVVKNNIAAIIEYSESYSVTLLNISSPSTVSSISTIPIDEEIISVEIGNDLMYITGQNNLFVYNISDSENIIPLVTYPSSLPINAVLAEGNLTSIATQDGVQILNALEDQTLRNIPHTQTSSSSTSNQGTPSQTSDRESVAFPLSMQVLAFNIGLLVLLCTRKHYADN